VAYLGVFPLLKVKTIISSQGGTGLLQANSKHADYELVETPFSFLRRFRLFAFA
jgi:hypothetical protein